jgi:catechol 2,3-dioxygenase-like lactoylglutathione lyase family enzyme
MPERRVVIDHLTIGVRDLERSRAFYRAALEPLGFEERGPWSDERHEIAFGAEGADRATTARSCSTPTRTTSRPCSTARVSAAGGGLATIAQW